MVGTKSPNSVDPTYLRKIRKPLVEKRRRDRMNHSLEQLKSLLAVSIKQTSSSPMSRLDKADILELTVGHLTTLEHQQRSVTLATEVNGYKKGFKDCARETINYLSSTRSLDTDTLFQLNNHLQSSYLHKTRQAPSTSYPADVSSAHASLQPDDSASANYVNLYVTQNSSYCKPISEYVGGVSLGSGDYYGCDQFYKQPAYSQYNGSEDTSLNSTCDMSLDSSSLTTPEKLLPVQGIDVSLDSSAVETPEKVSRYTSVIEDVWRPW